MMGQVKPYCVFLGPLFWTLFLILLHYTGEREADWSDAESSPDYLARMSGFMRYSYDVGYKDSVLNENVGESYKEGFRKGMEDIQKVRLYNGDVESTESVAFLLSKWRGSLNACLSLHTVEDKSRLESLVAELERLEELNWPVQSN